MNSIFVKNSWINEEFEDKRYLHIFDPSSSEIIEKIQDANFLLQHSDSYVNHPHKILYHLEPHYRTPSWWNTCEIIIASHKCISSNENTKVIYYPCGFFVLNAHGYVDYILKRSYKFNCANSQNLTQRKFCLFVNSNRDAKERIQFCQKLMKYKSVDCRGNVLNNCDKISHPYYTQEFINCIREYKFMICFENSDCDGYFTEKPMNAYLGDTIPIYWGNKESYKYFNEKSMVLLQEFNQGNIEKAIQRIKELDTNDDLYMETLRESLLKNNEFPEEFSIESIQGQVSEAINMNKKQLTHIFVIVSEAFEPRQFAYMKNFFQNVNLGAPVTFREPLYKGRDEHLFNRQKYIHLKTGEIGLAQTYERLFEHIVKNFKHQDTFLILESDVLFQENFKEKFTQVLQEFSNIPESKKVCFMGDGGAPPPKKYQKISSFLYKTDSTKCTDSMLMTYETIFQLLQDTQDNIINLPVDHMWNNFFEDSKIHSYWTEYPIVNQGSVCGVYNSSIR